MFSGCISFHLGHFSDTEYYKCLDRSFSNLAKTFTDDTFWWSKVSVTNSAAMYDLMSKIQLKRAVIGPVSSGDKVM